MTSFPMYLSTKKMSSSPMTDETKRCHPILIKKIDMSKDIKAIYDFDYRLIDEYFLGMERQGPGSPRVTIQALDFIDNLTDQSCIADIRCGTGGQTMVLAQNTRGKITAIDLSPEHIRKLNDTAERLNLQNRVNGIVGSMDNLPFHDEEFDLIWSEGSIYKLGFVRDLNECRRFLKKGGTIAISQISWFTSERPTEIENFWEKFYSEIDTIPNKVQQMQEAGYMPVATFVLPENCWTEHYFPLMDDAQEIFLRKYAGNKAAKDLLKQEQYVKEFYHKYKAYFGYAFYIGKRIK